MLPTTCFCFLLVLAVLTNASQDWQKFKTSHGKQYASASEEVKRKELFLKADSAIKTHNSQNHSWKMKHSFYSDLTASEKKQLLGTQAPKNISPSFSNRTSIKHKYDPNAQIPSELDHRKDECMTPPKSQGGCGSCWAFTAINSMEFQNCKNHGELTLLSEQHLVDCVYGDKGGCGGGFMGTAYNYFLYGNPNVAKGDLYPYETQNGKCHYTDSMKGAKLIDWQWAWPDKDPDYKKISKYMMQVLNNNVTIGASLHVPDEWGSYGSGVYTNKTNCDQPVNHGVVIVGYGTTGGLDYWIVRNSWGTTWGDGGYVKMRRGINQCRIEFTPLYPTMA